MSEWTTFLHLKMKIQMKIKKASSFFEIGYLQQHSSILRNSSSDPQLRSVENLFSTILILSQVFIAHKNAPISQNFQIRKRHSIEDCVLEYI